jgi:hypothetical protein
MGILSGKKKRRRNTGRGYKGKEEERGGRRIGEYSICIIIVYV